MISPSLVVTSLHLLLTLVLWEGVQLSVDRKYKNSLKHNLVGHRCWVRVKKSGGDLSWLSVAASLSSPISIGRCYVEGRRWIPCETVCSRGWYWMPNHSPERTATLFKVGQYSVKDIRDEVCWSFCSVCRLVGIQSRWERSNDVLHYLPGGAPTCWKDYVFLM